MDSIYIKHPLTPFNQCHTKEETILMCEERQGVLFQNINAHNGGTVGDDMSQLLGVRFPK